MGINNVSAQPQNVWVNNFNVENNQKRYFIDPRRTDKNIQADTVQLATKNDKLKKIGIGAAIAVGVAGIGTAVYFLTRGKVKLPDHLDFIPAQTKEEAIKYAKTQLGIKSYDSSMPLDVMNWVNEGITNVHNVRKGKVHLFNTVKYKAENDSSIAAFRQSIFRKKNILTVNKNYFENLDNNIDSQLKNLMEGKLIGKTKNGNFSIARLFYLGESTQNIMQHINKYIKNPKNLEFKDKVALSQGLEHLLNSYMSILKSPYNKIEQLLENENIQEILLAHSNLPDLKQIKKLSTEQQRNILIKMMNTCRDSGSTVKIAVHNADFLETIYHEIGHLEHCHNLGGMKKLVLMGKPEECSQILGKVSDVTNDFINSKEKQQIASSISDYATTSPAEFVAEVYNRLIQKALGAKDNIPDRALKLYQEYGGAMID